MRTRSAKDAKYGFGRLIDCARNGRQVRATGRRGAFGGGVRAAEGARHGNQASRHRGAEAKRGGRPLNRMDKRSLTECDICTKFITPALRAAGWDEMSQLREEVTFAAGRIFVRGRLVARRKRKRADYVLYVKPNIPIAVIEAKDNPTAERPTQFNWLPVGRHD